ncbi:MAG TPA: hypothetical protein VM029_11850 [Opitutaceae bacterium]|nr:hypothetical protein [Opitutaceae bacterium]
MPDTELSTLQKQAAKYESALAEFVLIENELRLRGSSARVADMLRINRETINSMERSLELVRLRLASAVNSRPSGAPFATRTGSREIAGSPGA